MIVGTYRLRLVALLLPVLVVTGCAAATPKAQLPSSTAFPSGPSTSTMPAEDVATPVAMATATDLPAPTITSGPQLTETSAIPPTPKPTAQPVVAVVANNYGEAPEINTEVWLNTDQPLRLEELRGRVVLVDFWTYG